MQCLHQWEGKRRKYRSIAPAHSYEPDDIPCECGAREQTNQCQRTKSIPTDVSEQHLLKYMCTSMSIGREKSKQSGHTPSQGGVSTRDVSLMIVRDLARYAKVQYAAGNTGCTGCSNIEGGDQG